MTAEIALLNRKAVALAADSIVSTVGQNNRILKTFDSAEKIFELSREKPIGLMYYNSTEFLHVPIEILVREFREEFDNDVNKIEDVWTQFEIFLLKESRGFPSLDMFIFDHFKVLVSGIYKTLENSPDIELEIKKIEYTLSITGTNDLQDIDAEKFEKKYGNFMHELADKFPKIKGYLEKKDTIYLKILELTLKTIKSRSSSSLTMGLVFAGFGIEERFPALTYVEIDGFYFEKVRVIKKENIAISRENCSGILPFAQKLMLDRFVTGIDDAYEQKIHEIFFQSLFKALKDITEIPKEKKDTILLDAVTNFISDLEGHKKSTLNDNLRVINHLSKKELAEYASSLVELSSRHHRFSSGIETVGGPIDVAIITKNEGFIWVNRKKYFEMDLNPSYAERRKLVENQ